MQKIIEELKEREWLANSPTGSAVGDFWVGLGLNTPVKRFLGVGGVAFAFTSVLSAPYYQHLKARQYDANRGGKLAINKRTMDAVAVGLPLVAGGLAAFVLS